MFSLESERHHHFEEAHGSASCSMPVTMAALAAAARRSLLNRLRVSLRSRLLGRNDLTSQKHARKGRSASSSMTTGWQVLLAREIASAAPYLLERLLDRFVVRIGTLVRVVAVAAAAGLLVHIRVAFPTRRPQELQSLHPRRQLHAREMNPISHC
eukprot:SAG31_NODE_1358_length_8643_cov_11.893375_2_plen_155_part_00